MRVYLSAPFAEKDIIKKKGGKWDAVKKQWYVENVENLSLFTKWIDQRLLTKNTDRARRVKND